MFDPLSRKAGRGVLAGAADAGAAAAPRRRRSIRWSPPGSIRSRCACRRGLARRLIARLGRPLAAPSANSSGRISATTARSRGRRSRRQDPADRRRRRRRRSGWNRPSSRSRADGCGCCGRAASPPRSSRRRSAAAAARAARRQASRRRACSPRTMRRAPRCGSTRRGRPGEALLGLRPQRAAGAEQARSPCSTCPPPAICARRRPICLPICRRSTAAARRPSPSSRSRDAGLGEAINDRLRRAAAPRDQLPLRQRLPHDRRFRSSTRLCSTASRRSSATHTRLRAEADIAPYRARAARPLSPAARRWC